MLELQALETLKLEYKYAIESGASFSKLLEIKQRIDTVKNLLIEQLLKKVG